jgi:Ca-activated chloride channel family protein
MMHIATHSLLTVFVHRKVSGLSAVLLGAILVAFTAPTSQAQSARDAARHFQEGRYDDALEIYRHLALENPDDPRFTYNAGVAAFKAGQLGEAMEQFDAASLAPDLNVQQQAHYNMANTLFRAGEATDDFEQKSEVWKQAVQRYQHALTINDEDTLAQDNLDFVKQRLEQLQQQQEQQEDQEQQNDEENKDDSSEDQQSESDSQDQQDQEQNESDQNEEDQEEGEQEEQDQGDENKENEPQEGKEKEEPKDPAESQQSKQNPGEETEGQGQPQEGKMTPEEAKQLLDAERDQAKAMIFSPPENRKSRNRNFKDW